MGVRMRLEEISEKRSAMSCNGAIENANLKNIAFSSLQVASHCESGSPL